MKDLIKLGSRGGKNNYLKKVANKEYQLKTPYSLRMGYVTDDKAFVDPSGGPMIVEGSYLEEAKATVKSIKFIKGKGAFVIFE